MGVTTWANGVISPVSIGLANQFLQTDGFGVQTWANAVTSAPTGFQVVGNALQYGPSLIPIANGGTNSSTATGTGSVVLQTGPTIIGSNHTLFNGFETSIPISFLDIGGGALLNGTGGSNQISFSYQTANNGFRHFIQSRHNSVVGPDVGNALWFYMNQSNLGATSASPGVGNVVAFKITGNGCEAPVSFSSPIVTATTSFSSPLVTATTSSLSPIVKVGAANYTAITSQAATPNVPFNLPSTVGVNGDYLLNTGSGNLSWTAGFSSGTWTPAFKYIDATGNIVNPNATLSATLYNGYYTKFGRNVTVFYDVLLNSTNGDQGLVQTRYPVITGLPFQCNVGTGGSRVASKQSTNTCSYPNGWAGALPAVGVSVHGTDRANAVINGAGESIPMYTLNIVVVSTTSWISDGFTIQLYCPSEYFIPAIAVPPYALGYSLEAPLSNTWIVGAGTFSGIRFKGSISYLTTS